MSDRQYFRPLALLRLQSWLSPAFPTGSYSYSHGLEWAVEAGHVHDRQSLVDWLEADLCYGSGRNEAIFFNEAWRSATRGRLRKVSLKLRNWRPPFGGHRNLRLKHRSRPRPASLRSPSVAGSLCWRLFQNCFGTTEFRRLLSVVLGVRAAKQGIPVELGLARISAKLHRQFGDRRVFA